MSETLFILPGTKPNPIVHLRVEADRACRKLAKHLRTDPEKLWNAAMWNQFQSEVFMCNEGEVFWESFMALNRAEVAEIEARRLTALQ